MHRNKRSDSKRVCMMPYKSSRGFHIRLEDRQEQWLSLEMYRNETMWNSPAILEVEAPSQAWDDSINLAWNRKSWDYSPLKTISGSDLATAGWKNSDLITCLVTVSLSLSLLDIKVRERWIIRFSDHLFNDCFLIFQLQAFICNIEIFEFPSEKRIFFLLTRKSIIIIS